MTLPDGQPKGAALVLEERGYNMRGMKLEEIKAILAGHDDLKNKKCPCRQIAEQCWSHMFLSPSFTVSSTQDRVWSQSKHYTRAYCDYSSWTGTRRQGKIFKVNQLHITQENWRQ